MFFFNVKKHLAPTPLHVDFSLRQPSKKIIGIFFLQKNCWKKHCLKWPKMTENAILTQLIIFFWKKCGKWPGPDLLITQVWTPKKSGKRPSLSVEFSTLFFWQVPLQNKCKRINVSFVLHCAVGFTVLHYAVSLLHCALSTGCPNEKGYLFCWTPCISLGPS